VDEKSQIQALDRTQPILPVMPGVPERQTHDYKHNGTTTLFAALEVATGKISADACYQRHTNTDFLKFLKLQSGGSRRPAECPSAASTRSLVAESARNGVPAARVRPSSRAASRRRRRASLGSRCECRRKGTSQKILMTPELSGHSPRRRS
jgi:hypothetical protein